LPATLPAHASQLYARNIANLLLSIAKDGELGKLDSDEDVQKDDVLREILVTRGGTVVHPRVRSSLGLSAAAQPT
jgi:NAD(P) transhydrogenase subunit alpha